MILGRPNDTLHLKKRCVMKVEHDHYHKVHKIAASLIRHLLIAWLAAATVELLLLPDELKTMNGLKALSAMSFPRLLIIAGIVFALLEGTSRFLPVAIERWTLAGIFAVLAATALRLTFTRPFLSLCLLVAALLDIRLRTAIPAIFVGLLIAGTLTLGVTMGVIHVIF